MQGNITLTMIKPDAMRSGYIGKILDHIVSGGFSIRAAKVLHLTHYQAEKFYLVHKDRPFYRDLVEFMSSGPILAAVLEKENAVDAFRQLIGSTDPAKAETGTIRNLYGASIQENAVHGSDSDENALIEAAFFFNQFERV
ncbi:MAG: nucleoside-diphosphate kinase [Bacteroidetes bacterium]|nr:nucleoside-diphosphate kinase [Bacteroidota bacterium]